MGSVPELGLYKQIRYTNQMLAFQQISIESDVCFSAIKIDMRSLNKVMPKHAAWVPKHKAWVPSSILGSNMRSSTFFIAPKPNLSSLLSSVAYHVYQDLYIIPFIDNFNMC